MKPRKILSIFLGSMLVCGCSELAGAKLLLPEEFGLVKIESNLYVEDGAGEEAKANLRAAMRDAESAIKLAYGRVTSKPVVNVCVSEDCYRSFGGMGSKAKIYGSHILLSPRGSDWHFLAHEWSHDELRQRLSVVASYRLPQWFDEGVAVAISEAPEHSDEHWEFLEKSNIPRPTREQLLTYRTLRDWLNAVEEYGETQNADRKARGEPEIRPVYTAAGHEVRAWLRTERTAGLLSLIADLNEGEAFENVYFKK